MNDLFDNPKLFDDNWRVSVAVELAIWRSHFVDAAEKTAPPRYAAAHAKYVAALDQYNSATYDIAYALDHITAADATARLNLATQKMQEGNRLIEEATALLK